MVVATLPAGRLVLGVFALVGSGRERAVGASVVEGLGVVDRPGVGVGSAVSLSKVAGGGVWKQGPGDAAARAPRESPTMDQQYTGVDLAEEMFDLMRRRLPRLAADDPLRPQYQGLVTSLASALERPALVPVPLPATG